MFDKIDYKNLNSRQKENYNFQKVAGHLADYGYNCLLLSDDWNGADFLACHIDGNRFLKVQLKGRLTFEKKYIGKDIYIAFNYKGDWYVYPHDEVQALMYRQGFMKGSVSSEKNGAYSWGPRSGSYPRHHQALPCVMKKPTIKKSSRGYLRFYDHVIKQGGDWEVLKA